MLRPVVRVVGLEEKRRFRAAIDDEPVAAPGRAIHRPDRGRASGRRQRRARARQHQRSGIRVRRRVVADDAGPCGSSSDGDVTPPARRSAPRASRRSIASSAASGACSRRSAAGTGDTPRSHAKRHRVGMRPASMGPGHSTSHLDDPSWQQLEARPAAQLTAHAAIDATEAAPACQSHRRVSCGRSRIIGCVRTKAAVPIAIAPTPAAAAARFASGRAGDERQTAPS